MARVLGQWGAYEAAGFERQLNEASVAGKEIRRVAGRTIMRARGGWKEGGKGGEGGGSCLWVCEPPGSHELASGTQCSFADGAAAGKR
jgi:hypothetical protein